MINCDRRPRDWTYLVGFDRKDFPLLMDIAKYIRLTHDTDMIENINNQFENRNQTITIGNKTLKTNSIAKTDDLVVDVGLDQCIRLIQGTSSARWSHMYFSNSNSSGIVTYNNINIGDWVVGSNVLPLLTFGWSEAKGMKLFFAAIVPQTPVAGIGGVNIQTINELGVYNGTAGGPTSDMLNRETFHLNPLTRDITNDLAIFANVYICSCVVEFCPVA